MRRRYSRNFLIFAPPVCFSRFKERKKKKGEGKKSKFPKIKFAFDAKPLFGKEKLISCTTSSTIKILLQALNKRITLSLYWRCVKFEESKRKEKENVSTTGVFQNALWRFSIQLDSTRCNLRCYTYLRHGEYRTLSISYPFFFLFHRRIYVLRMQISVNERHRANI